MIDDDLARLSGAPTPAEIAERAREIRERNLARMRGEQLPPDELDEKLIRERAKKRAWEQRNRKNGRKI